MKNKKLIFALISIFVFGLAISSRIYHVNATAPNTPEIHFDQTKTVALDGDFQESSAENTAGYFVKVISATHTTYTDFVQQYNAPEDYLPEGQRPKELVLVEMEFTNVSNDTGYIFLFNYFLATTSYALKPDLELWELVQPNGQGQMKVSLQPDTAYKVLLPYAPSPADEDMGTFVGKTDDFMLVVSRYPTKKMIDFHISDSQDMVG